MVTITQLYLLINYLLTEHETIMSFTSAKERAKYYRELAKQDPEKQARVREQGKIR